MRQLTIGARNIKIIPGKRSDLISFSVEEIGGLPVDAIKCFLSIEVAKGTAKQFCKRLGLEVEVSDD